MFDTTREEWSELNIEQANKNLLTKIYTLLVLVKMQMQQNVLTVVSQIIWSWIFTYNQSVCVWEREKAESLNSWWRRRKKATDSSRRKSQMCFLRRKHFLSLLTGRNSMYSYDFRRLQGKPKKFRAKRSNRWFSNKSIFQPKENKYFGFTFGAYFWPWKKWCNNPTPYIL